MIIWIRNHIDGADARKSGPAQEVGMVKLQIDIPEDFWKEEVRCGYTVSEEMKKVWAVELDMLHLLDTVCKKYGLRYFADSGTLL